MQLRIPAVLAVVSVSLGCPAPSGSESSAEGSESSGSHTTGEASEGGPGSESTSGAPSTTAVADDGSSSASSSSGGEDPNGSLCDADQQDCPDGFKCVLRRGSDDWEFVCLPVQGQHEAGDPCMHDGVIAGTDTCTEDTWCIGSFDTTGRPWDGVCYPLCVGDGCEDDGVCVGIGALPVCAPACDPLLPGACGGAEACILRGFTEGFVCFPAGADPNGQGEPCETAIGCEPGLHCSQNVAECTAEEYCCTELCDATDPEAVCASEAEGASCVALGVETPGQDHVGACVVP